MLESIRNYDFILGGDELLQENGRIIICEFNKNKVILGATYLDGNLKDYSLIFGIYTLQKKPKDIIMFKLPHRDPVLIAYINETEKHLFTGKYHTYGDGVTAEDFVENKSNLQEAIEDLKFNQSHQLFKILKEEKTLNEIMNCFQKSDILKTYEKCRLEMRLVLIE